MRLKDEGLGTRSHAGLLVVEVRTWPPRLHTCRISQSSHHTAMHCSSQGINFLNQLLEEIDDGGQRTKVVEGSWVSPLTSGHTLLAQEFD